MKKSVLSLIFRVKNKMEAQKTAKRKGKKPISYKSVDVLFVVAERLQKEGYSPQESVKLALRIRAAKKALNKLKIGNSKSDPKKMHRIFELLERDFREERSRTAWGKGGESNFHQQHILFALSKEIGSKWRMKKFLTEYGKVLEEFKKTI